MREDKRPAFVLDQVNGIAFLNLKARKASGVSTFVLRNVENFEAFHCEHVADVKVVRAGKREF